MAYIKFTPEQIEQAQNADLKYFPESRGERLKRSGSEWEWRDGRASACSKQRHRGGLQISRNTLWTEEQQAHADCGSGG